MVEIASLVLLIIACIMIIVNKITGAGCEGNCNQGRNTCDCMSINSERYRRNYKA